MVEVGQCSLRGGLLARASRLCTQDAWESEMSYLATAVPVMVASPGDVQDLRGIARDVLHEWNFVNSLSFRAVLLPVGWETHSSPELGAAAQDLINDRVLSECDLLIGIFWARLGTPTVRAASGTVEEIKRHVAAGKPAMIYFCSAPIPQDSDLAQFSALQDFKAWCMVNGLIWVFGTPAEFRELLKSHLPITLHKNTYIKKIINSASSVGAVGVPAVGHVPADPLLAKYNSLSPEAQQLLRAVAADPGGVVITSRSRGGLTLQTRDNVFGGSSDRRTEIKWEDALQELITSRLFARRSSRECSITSAGYAVSDNAAP